MSENLINLQGISKQYNHKILLNEINLSINKGDKIAIIGKNGSGKSTLLNIIANTLDFDSGNRISQNNLKIASLSQQSSFEPHLSVEAAMQECMQELKNAHKRLNELSLLMQDSQDKSLLNEYAQLSNLLDVNNGWDLESKLDSLLEYFDLAKFRHKLANSLSGGEQKRLSLACLLLQQSDILLLDEPTNHLDASMVRFLENFLLELKGTIVFISHDRYFIDKVATCIIELDNGFLRSFSGGYLDYLAQKEALLSNLAKEHQKLLKLLKSEQEWFNRGVKARLKRNEGRKARYLELKQKAKSNPSIINKMRLELEREQKAFNQIEGKNNKKCLFEIENLHKKMGEKQIINNLNLRILQNEKIGIVGHNGCGKSSFLKLLLGELKPDSGVIKKGEISIGYFDQHTQSLDDSKDLLETFCPNGGEHIEVDGKHLHVYGYLKNFLFPKEYLSQKIGFLSGGEKTRVALALLFTKKYDVLILDEPTNNLDLQTINILEQYLLSMNASILFVSHDRYFVDKLAQKILIFEGDGKVSVSAKSYSEYLELDDEIKRLNSYKIESANSKDSNKEANLKESSPKVINDIKKEQKAQTKLSYNEQRLLDSLPLELQTLESKIATLQHNLSTPEIYEKIGISTLAKELQELEQELDSKLERYIILDEKAKKLKGLA